MRNADYIEIKGLKQNNLRNVSLQIPKKKIVVFTGTPREMAEHANTITAKYLRKSVESGAGNQVFSA